MNLPKKCVYIVHMSPIFILYYKSQKCNTFPIVTVLTGWNQIIIFIMQIFNNNLAMYV